MLASGFSSPDDKMESCQTELCDALNTVTSARAVGTNPGKCHNTVAQWETFAIAKVGDGTFSIQMSHRKFILVQPDGQVDANRRPVGAWEKVAIAPGRDLV
jgi:hypothetical protein